MKTFVIGGGFAGITAVKELSNSLEITEEIYLIDKNEYTTMLPNLPEIVSGRLNKQDITEKIENLIPSRVGFIKEEILAVSFDKKEIKTNASCYNYDYLIFAPGSNTNFYNFNDNLDKVNVLESLNSANKVRKDFLEYLEKHEKANLVISGAGFTGIELACNLYDLSKKQHKKINIYLVELGKKVLPMISEKAQKHVVEKLNKLEFKILTDNQIVKFDGKDVTLKNGEIIKDSFFCWCSGVKNSIIPEGNYETIRDGRIMVKADLSLPNYSEVFIAGDAAAIKDKNVGYLRRGVNFSQVSGKTAAYNISAQVKGKEKKPFKTIDLGWMIPMYITGVGVAMGVELKGRKGIFMHYMICGIKNYNFKNFCKELIAAIKYSFTKA